MTYEEESAYIIIQFKVQEMKREKIDHNIMYHLLVAFIHEIEFAHFQ